MSGRLSSCIVYIKQNAASLFCSIEVFFLLSFSSQIHIQENRSFSLCMNSRTFYIKATTMTTTSDNEDEENERKKRRNSRKNAHTHTNRIKRQQKSRRRVTASLIFQQQQQQQQKNTNKMTAKYTQIKKNVYIYSGKSENYEQPK